MIRILIAAACFFAIAFGARAGEQPKAAAVAVAETETVGELVSLDRAARIAVVRSAATGATLAIMIPPEAQNLDRVKPGDLFRMRYLEAMVLSLNKGGAASASELQTVELAPKGGTPGGAVVNTKQITAVVSAIDRTKRTIGVRGPNKNEMTLKVADDVRSFDDIALGDTIALTYTEALLMEMIQESRPATTNR